MKRPLPAALVLLLALAPLLAACSNPQPGPDKTVAGAVLGAGWGAGAGTIIGHQVSYAGEGAAIGAGFGLVQGAIVGGGYDVIEGTQLEHERQLAALKIQNEANSRQLAAVQEKLDESVGADVAGGIYQVFFDTDASSLRAGAMANLEIIAESLKRNPAAYVVNVVGHADDAGSPGYNDKLAEARARAVSAALMAHGLAAGQIRVTSFGAKRPMTSNSTEPGRQLNRRVDIYIARN